VSLLRRDLFGFEPQPALRNVTEGAVSLTLTTLHLRQFAAWWNQHETHFVQTTLLPPDVVRLGIWLYVRFTLSLRDVEDLLAERGVDVAYETVPCWANTFGPAIAANIRRRRGRADSVWHLDETVVRIDGQRMDMWRAVDKEGAVLDVLVQKRRDKTAALKLLRKLLKNQGATPDAIVTDGLKSYPAAMKVLGCIDRHRPGRLRDINRAENSHLPVRRREQVLSV